jgi:hypothetical protein
VPDSRAALSFLTGVVFGSGVFGIGRSVISLLKSTVCCRPFTLTDVLFADVLCALEWVRIVLCEFRGAVLEC